MFKITLLQTNDAQRGKRHEIDSSPFLIGRSENCDLVFPSRSVSRKHCVIIFNESDVLIRDLGSRNGTLVDGGTITPEVPRQLSHHCVLRIGKYFLRLSIRDEVTKKPYQPELIDLSTLSGPTVVPSEQNKGAAQLIRELDELASRMDLQRESDPGLNATQATDPAAGKTTASDTDESSSVSLTPEPGDQENNKDGNKEAGSGSIGDASAVEEMNPEARGDPKKLPEHLKPQRPKDSQSAAAKALKNLFVK